MGRKSLILVVDDEPGIHRSARPWPRAGAVTIGVRPPIEEEGCTV
jgi:hypothetical protein